MPPQSRHHEPRQAGGRAAVGPFRSAVRVYRPQELARPGVAHWRHERFQRSLPRGTVGVPRWKTIAGGFSAFGLRDKSSLLIKSPAIRPVSLCVTSSAASEARGRNHARDSPAPLADLRHVIADALGGIPIGSASAHHRHRPGYTRRRVFVRRPALVAGRSADAGARFANPNHETDDVSPLSDLSWPPTQIIVRGQAPPRSPDSSPASRPCRPTCRRQSTAGEGGSGP